MNSKQVQDQLWKRVILVKRQAAPLLVSRLTSFRQALQTCPCLTLLYQEISLPNERRSYFSQQGILTPQVQKIHK